MPCTPTYAVTYIGTGLFFFSIPYFFSISVPVLNGSKVGL